MCWTHAATPDASPFRGLLFIIADLMLWICLVKLSKRSLSEMDIWSSRVRSPERKEMSWQELKQNCLTESLGLGSSTELATNEVFEKLWRRIWYRGNGHPTMSAVFTARFGWNRSIELHKQVIQPRMWDAPRASMRTKAYPDPPCNQHYQINIAKSKIWLLVDRRK